MAENQAPAYAGMPKEQLHDEIKSAPDLGTLDAIAEQITAVGFSREGLTYALILERRGVLGAELTEEEEQLVNLAKVRTRRARGLPAAEVSGGETVPPSEE